MPGTEPSPRRRESGGLPLAAVWVTAALAFPLTVVLSGSIGSVDLAYAVRAGQLMLRSGHVLRTDPFLLTTRCDPWLNQQWGAELLLGGVFDALGWFGLTLLRAALTAGVLGFTYAACRARGAERRAAAALTFLAAVLLMGGLSLRAQLFGLLLFAVTLWIVARRHEHPAALLLVVPLMALWANLHGSFPFGIVLVLLAWLEDLTASRPAARTLAVAVLGAAATLLNPFGPSVWTYVLDLSTNPVIRTVVEEWRAPWAILSYTGVVFFGSAALAAVVLWRQRRSLPWPTIVGLGIFLALAATSTRADYWWGLVLPVTLAALPWARRTGADVRNRANWALAGALALVPLVALLRWLPFTGEAAPAGRVAFAPPGVTAELRTRLAPGEPFANPQSWGSWFELALPGHPLFVDSRFELMPVQSLRANHRISAAEDDWERDLDALGIRVLVVDRDREPRLAAAMPDVEGWDSVYADEDGLIFVRTGAAPVPALPPCPITR